MGRVLTVDVEQVAATTSQATLRSHSVLIDRPIEKGGNDKGPLGGELLLASLGGCFTSTLLAAAKARDAAVSDVRVRVAGTVGGVPERFEAISMTVSATYRDRDETRKLLEIAARGCLVTNTLKDAVVISVELEAKP